MLAYIFKALQKQLFQKCKLLFWRGHMMVCHPMPLLLRHHLAFWSLPAMRRKRHQVLHFSILYITLLLLGSIGKLQGEKKNRSPSAVGGTISAPTSSDTLSPTSGVSQNHQEGTNSLGKKQSEKPKDRTPSLNTSSKKSSLYNCLQNTSKHHVQIRPRNSLFGPWFSPFPNRCHHFPVTAPSAGMALGANPNVPKSTRSPDQNGPKSSVLRCLQVSLELLAFNCIQLYH